MKENVFFYLPDKNESSIIIIKMSTHVRRIHSVEAANVFDAHVYSFCCLLEISLAFKIDCS